MQKKINLCAKYIVFVLIALTNIFSCSTYANTLTNKKMTALSKYIHAWRSSHHIPAIALTISQAENQPVTLVDGYKNSNKKVKITNNTLFQVGSITKTFVSAAILQQVAKGKITLATKIGRWFPQYPRWKNITVRQLLNMTSGIYRYMHDKNYIKQYAEHPQKQWSIVDLINIAYKHQDYAMPGKEWHYSNTNYLILGLILEKITHQSLAKYFYQHFFKPLTLNHTHYITTSYKQTILRQIANGYFNTKNVTQYSMSTYGAAGAMLSTSSDINHWIKALFTPGLVIKQKQLEKLLQTVPFNAPPKPKNSRYGLGLYYSHSKQYGDMWWYSGVTNGYISLFMYLPKAKLMITGNINAIHNQNYWVFMPNNDFVKHLLKVLIQ